MQDQPTPPARRPGRPAARAGQANQRERLLDIALLLCAKHGAAETTIAAVARKAQMTPAAAHYYFKTREQLLDSLLEERFMPVRATFEDVFEAHPDEPFTVIKLLVERLMNINSRYPWFGTFWLREMISEDDMFKQRVHLRMGRQQHMAMLDTVKRWQRDGLINAQIDPMLLFTSLIGLTVFPLSASVKWKDDPMRAHLGPQQISDHAWALLLRGLQP
ncbi:TetR/AcrR family transcriptional regulator [Amantichitinum ursilacus]|uniref:Transcriptional regulator BetI n=1 Tax=Amantichitinum ursilacus TaxID=857265 RepID=A0A0N0XJ49_9NEIS|nr:TetR/AcrR family transcriptional regulator [Amantichitinum ursilacus]KPC50398.1 transcriptional regulator BetI [Amantichitinum ursilacus]